MRLLIIGGSDAGISAGLRARELRPDIEVAILLADTFPNYSVCGLPFYVSAETPKWESLAHRTEFPGIELHCGRLAESIDVRGRVVTARTPEGLTETFRYDRLLIATGARPIVPETIAADLIHPLHTMRDSFKVHDLVESGKVRHAAVVGAGYIGLEMADALSHRGIEVDIIGRSPSVLPTVDHEVGELVRNQLESRHVRVHTGLSVERVRRVQDRVVIEATDGFSLQTDLIVWATGVSPSAELAKAAGVETGIQGACKVTRRMETSVPFVYAAGDCVETWHRVLDAPSWLPLGTTAHKQGRVARRECRRRRLGVPGHGGDAGG